MTLVGIISDTHGHLAERAYCALADCDFIIHAGDIGTPGIIRELRTIAPVAAVLGNNDFDEYGSEIGRFAKPEIEGVRFLVAHYPQDVRLSARGCPGVQPGEALPHVCVHGHTHIPRLEFGKAARPADYIVNPGSASRPRGGFDRSIAKMSIEHGRVQRIVIESIFGKELMRIG